MKSHWQPRRYLHLALALLGLLFLLPVAARELDRSPAPATPAADAAPEVRFSLPSGAYDEAITVELTASEPEAAVYFTTDGSTPQPETAALYTEPLRLPADPPGAVAVRARAVRPDGRSGPAASASYFLGLEASLPLVSLAIDPADLYDEETGIFAQPFNRGPAWERPAEVFFYDPQRMTGFQAAAGARVHGGQTREDEKKSVRLYFRPEYGQAAVEYPLFPTTDRQSFKRLVLHNGGQDYPAASVNGSLLRNDLTGVLARQAGGLATHTRPVLLFLNGQLWGVYNLRERIDDRYLAESYQVDDPDLLGGFEDSLIASAGDLRHWENLLAFVAQNDLRDPAHYRHLQTQLNLDNFIDYNLIQIITANADWPHSNQTKFRERSTGRWHWMFWDSDFAFGLLPDSYPEKNMFERVLQHEDERQQQAALLLSKLLENPDFRARFLARLADLLNTIYAPANVLDALEPLAVALAADIGYETRRWPGAGDWQAAVDGLRDFARRRPDIVRAHAVEMFELPGTAVLAITTPAAGRGSVSINGAPAVEPLPWQGVYFQGVDLRLTAVPAPGYRFAGWEPAKLPQTPALTLSPGDDLTITPRFAPDEDGPQPGDVRLHRYGRDGDPAPVNGLRGDWVELQVMRPGGVDLRGWRVTDNDAPDVYDEGSLLLGDDPALANVPPGTILLLVARRAVANDRLFAADDLSPLDGRLALYAGNGLLDTRRDPWFRLGQDDNLALLAPGATGEPEDDRAIDFVHVGRGSRQVNAATFGLLGDEG